MSPEPILAFDTAGPHCAVGCGSAHLYEPMAKGQAERLMPMIEAVLAEAGHHRTDLRGIGVGTGPGNFTGLRVATAAARAMALALQIPAVGVSAFEVLHSGWERPGQVMLSLPAPRGQAYVQIFVDRIPQGAPVLLTPGELGHAEARDQPDLCVVGWEAHAIARPFDAEAEDRASDPAQASRTIAAIAHAKLTGALPWDRVRPAPLYGRAPDAAPARQPAPKILA